MHSFLREAIWDKTNNLNIELRNTSGIPNPIHSKNLVDWLSSGNLIDKYRSLNPTKKIYSYVPFNRQSLNRSRIDHILVSKNTSDFIFEVEYRNLIAKSFDHKPLFVSLGKKKSKIEKCIDLTLLHLPNLYDSVKYTVMELYVNNFNTPDKNDLIFILDRINATSRSLQLLETFSIKHPNDLLCKVLINNYKNCIYNLCNQFPSIESFWNYQCTLQPDVFL